MNNKCIVVVFLLFTFKTFSNNRACLDYSKCECPTDSLKVKHKMDVENKGIRQVTSCITVPDAGGVLSCISSKSGKLDCSLKGIDSCLKFIDQIPGTLNLPKNSPLNCGYDWANFNFSQFKRDINTLIETDKINCSPSMCTSATFMALVAHAKKLRSINKIDEETYRELIKPGGMAYQILNAAAQPNELVEKYRIGKGHEFTGSQIRNPPKSIPKKGDFVQIWRKDGSGHSVVFMGHLDDDGDGRPDQMCYWSSQPVTKGYGLACEKSKNMTRVLVGSLD